jgi:hypothetical protein
MRTDLLRPTPVRSRPDITVEQGVAAYQQREREKRFAAAVAYLRQRIRDEVADGDGTLGEEHVLTFLESWREARAAGVRFGACSISFEGHSWLVPDSR